MILYINGNRIQLEKSNPTPLTKQVNTIGSLSTRQNDYVENIKAPLTSDNNRALNYLNASGSVSQIPYNRNTAKLYSDTGESIINNGFAVVKRTDQNYNITIYEGVISFWKKIENITLKDIGLSELNHLRNVPSIIDSLENDLKYRYLLADYNGKFLSDALNLNADYLIPSALVEYIWERVFDYAGYTYTGTIFSDTQFTEMYVTYPKSIGSTNQQTDVLHTENFTTQTVDAFFPDPSGFGYRVFYYPYIFQDLIPSNIYVESFGVYNEYVDVLTDGLYQFKFNGFLGFPDDEASYGIYYWVNDASNVVEILNNIDRNTNIDLTVNLNLEVGDRVFFGFSSSVLGLFGVQLSGANLDTSIALVTGDSIDFEEAFVDFKCTDFVKEIMFQFSLTPFTSRFENSILFLTEDERYLNEDRIDWSNKFVTRLNTEYEIGYAQKNNFKYQYNNENENHNDGNILVNNVNLREEDTVIQSVTYSPERFRSVFGSESFLQVKMWEKEIQDDGSIEYKDLRKRFHFLRQENISGSITIESDIISQVDSTTQAKKATFLTLNYASVISTRYKSTRTILNSTKVEDVLLYINQSEAVNLDLTKRYHFKQLGGDYVINKMTKYIPNQSTRFELLKINERLIAQQPDEGTPLFIEITDLDITDCTLTLDVDTNIVQPQDLQIRCTNAFVDPVFGTPLVDLFFDVTLAGNQVVFDLDLLPFQPIFKFHFFSLKYLTTISNATETVSIGECGNTDVVPPTEFISIDSFQTIEIDSNIRTVRLNFSTDFAPLPSEFTATATIGILGDQNLPPVVVTEVVENSIDIQVQHSYVGQPFPGLRYYWNMQISKDGVLSNIITSTT